MPLFASIDIGVSPTIGYAFAIRTNEKIILEDNGA